MTLVYSCPILKAKETENSVSVTAIKSEASTAFSQKLCLEVTGSGARRMSQTVHSAGSSLRQRKILAITKVQQNEGMLQLVVLFHNVFWDLLKQGNH